MTMVFPYLGFTVSLITSICLILDSKSSLLSKTNFPSCTQIQELLRKDYLSMHQDRYFVPRHHLT